GSWRVRLSRQPRTPPPAGGGAEYRSGPRGPPAQSAAEEKAWSRAGPPRLPIAGTRAPALPGMRHGPPSVPSVPRYPAGYPGPARSPDSPHTATEPTRDRPDSLPGLPAAGATRRPHTAPLTAVVSPAPLPGARGQAYTPHRAMPV